MNITFLVGNGFDIHMGLATAYSEVKSHYIKLEKDDLRLQAFQRSMSENGSYWSNFELALGQYTEKFQEDSQADYLFCLEDFTEELIAYLQIQEARIDYELCAEEIQKEFIRSISEYIASIPNRSKKDLNAIIANNGGVVFRFASFNYTHILDKCLQLSFGNDTIVGNHKMNGSIFTHTVNSEVLHIHGELPGPIIMGVDNSSQIANRNWAGQRRFQQKIAKPEINTRAGSLVDDDLSRLINGSNIICVYGMSLGETDKTWWKIIRSWLNGADHRLILFGHNNNINRLESHQRQFTIQDELVDRFLELAEVNGADRAIIESRIIPVINPNLFDINLVELTQTKKVIDEFETKAHVEELSEELEKRQKIAKLHGLLTK